jgi:hypothetical protein
MIFLLTCLFLIDLSKLESVNDSNLIIHYGTKSKYLIEFIEEGQELVGNLTIKNKAVLILSAKPSTSLFSYNISDNVFPTVINTEGEDFSVIEYPGFKHNRGLAYETASYFLLKEITERVDLFKFILTFTYENLNEEFYDVYKRLSYFITLREDTTIKDFDESICIIVKNFENKNVSKEQIKNQIVQIMKNITNTHYELHFQKIINIEILSNMNLSEDIFASVNKIEYVETSKLYFFLKRNKNFNIQLGFYTNDHLRQFEIQTQKTIRDNFYNLLSSPLISLNQLENQYTMLTKLKPTYKQNYDIESFLNDLIKNNLVNDKFIKQINKLILRKRILSYLINLCKSQLKLKFQKQLFADLDKLNIMIFMLSLDTQIKYELLEVNFYKSMASNLLNYTRNKIKDAIYVENINDVEKLIQDFKNQSNYSKSFYEFINKTLIDSKYRNILCKAQECDNILNSTSSFDRFINKLKEDKNTLFSKNQDPKKWLYTSELSLVLNDLETYRKNYSFSTHEEVGAITFKSNFGKISEILKIINNDIHIDIKVVRIFSTFTLEFDTDYKLDKNKYKTNAPDLVIISPKVIAEKPITIDLSCENIPGYPDNLKKAKNGYSSGENGYDGKPGLPGYNAGNLIILADSITNLSNLQTNLAGGTGGPGQDGILDFF